MPPTAAPAATATPQPTAAPTAPPAPAVTATPQPTATPELDTVYSDHGFTLNLDLGADVQATGWTEAEPSDTQGLVSFTYGGALTGLVWSPADGRDPLSLLAYSYNVLRAAQPDITFESISDGDITVSDQAGVFGGFKALDSSGATLGGGLVGAMGKDFLGQVDAGQRVELFQGLGLDLSGDNIEGVEGQDIAALMGGMDRSHLDQLGGQGIINAMQRIGDLQDLGLIGGDTAFDVLGAVGLDQLQGLDQLMA